MTKHEIRSPDMEETKTHIFAAGRELLLAAQGALSFCKDYVETSVPQASRPTLIGFFQKAITVADELGRGISGVSNIRRTAGKIAKPLFTAMASEMKREAEEGREVSSPGKPHTRGRRGAASRPRRRV